MSNIAPYHFFGNRLVPIAGPLRRTCVCLKSFCEFLDHNGATLKFCNNKRASETVDKASSGYLKIWHQVDFLEAFPNGTQLVDAALNQHLMHPALHVCMLVAVRYRHRLPCTLPHQRQAKGEPQTKPVHFRVHFSPTGFGIGAPSKSDRRNSMKPIPDSRRRGHCNVPMDRRA